MPKATVQAALGPAALETVHLLQLGDQAERIGSNILALSVISILVTGPLGAVAMQCAGPRLLRKKATEDANDTSAEQDYTAIWFYLGRYFLIVEKGPYLNHVLPYLSFIGTSFFSAIIILHCLSKELTHF